MADELLREMIRSEFGHVNGRLDEIRSDVKDLRGDVKKLGEVSGDNTTDIVRHTEQLKTLFGRSGGERGRLMFYGTLVVGGGTAVVWLLKVVGVIKG